MMDPKSQDRLWQLLSELGFKVINELHDEIIIQMPAYIPNEERFKWLKLISEVFITPAAEKAAKDFPPTPGMLRSPQAGFVSVPAEELVKDMRASTYLKKE